MRGLGHNSMKSEKIGPFSYALDYRQIVQNLVELIWLVTSTDSILKSHGGSKFEIEGFWLVFQSF